MKILKWPAIYIVVQFALLILIGVGFIYFGNNPADLGMFLEKYRFVLGIILGLIFIPLLVKNYTKKDKKVNKINYFYVILLGISLSIIFNTLFFYISKVVPLGNLFQKSDYIFSLLITVGIIGPIIEEYMFRGIIYNELKEKHSNIKSILITTFLFMILHFSSVQIIYAFIIGIILIYIYEKFKSIKVPIVLHMASNITTTIILTILINNNFTLNYILYVISLVVLSLIVLLHKKNVI